jgi:hypothetical protein
LRQRLAEVWRGWERMREGEQEEVCRGWERFGGKRVRAGKIDWERLREDERLRDLSRGLGRLR